MTKPASHPHHHTHQKKAFDRFSTAVTRASGSSWAFLAALIIVVIWGLCGPFFGFSNTWQLVINTGTTIVTFLMVFVIQQSQNKDTLAIQLKLNELIASDSAANNRLVDIEDLSPEELAVLKKFYVKLARLAETDDDVHASHSLDEAQDRHANKIAAAPAIRDPQKRRARRGKHAGAKPDAPPAAKLDAPSADRAEDEK
jgi:low affinity Fe/Cu permease